MNLDIYPDILVNLEALGLDFRAGLGGFIDAFLGNGDAGAEAGADVEATGLSSELSSGSSGVAVDADLEAETEPAGLSSELSSGSSGVAVDADLEAGADL